MIRNINLIAFILALFSFYGCKDDQLDYREIDDSITVTTTVSNASPFSGLGTQWGGYDIVNNLVGQNSLSQADWDKMFKRVDFLKPGLVRIMTSQGWNYYDNGTYDPEKSSKILFKILDYCESHNISVIFGEWGEPALANNQVNTAWIDRSTNFLGYLINTKGYTCIKYYNMCNEPAASWSTIAGNYQLWQDTFDAIFQNLEAKGLNSKVKVIAPDVAVWNDTTLLDWMTRPMNHFGNKIGTYAIHAYPSDDQLLGGNYKTTIDAYRKAVPQNSEMLMGELGFKYNVNSLLGKENEVRIKNTPHTAEDSNMLVHDAFYGVDLSAAVIQTIKSGYNGTVVWDMDDAMYDDGAGNLKRWGFWNSLGTEYAGGAADEEIRPFFYTMSLLCRNFPRGATIYNVNLPDKKGIEAIAAMKDGKYTIVITNTHTVSYNLNLKMENGISLSNAKVYNFIAGKGAEFIGNKDNNGFATPTSTQTIDFSGGKSFSIETKAKSFTLITNMD